MKNYKPSILITMSILVVFGVLFSYVPQGHAQEGQDWTEPVNLSYSGVGINPLLVVDFDGTLHALWIDNFDGEVVDEYRYSQSTDDGVTWTPAQAVNFPFDEKDALPTILADSSGILHIFWLDSKFSLFYNQAKPQDLANPFNWQTNTRLDNNVLSYDVKLDSRGVLHIAYITNSKSNAISPGVYYRQSNVGGGSWSAATNLYESVYFRSIKVSDAFVRLAVSNSSKEQNVYVTWDSRPQKRVFMAVSNDSGLNWNEAQQIMGAEDTGGIASPYNFNVAAVNDKVLIMWQVGQPGSSKCVMFSQWSKDGGKNWGELVNVLGEIPECPINSRFVIQKKDYIVAMLIGQVNPILVAWNGERWSDSQAQVQLPAFSNPLTYDTVNLDCRFELLHNDRLYVVGCDQGGGGDVWFLSRPLEPLKNWFSPPKYWGPPAIISENLEPIFSLSSVTDTHGVIHTSWIRSSLSDDGSRKTTIEYARYDGVQWTNPETVISSLRGVPLQVSMSIDSQERLLLTWADGESGDILFSWANSDRANLASEWEEPVGLPSPTNLASSPDILVDGSSRIVVVYAIPLNEERGIYIVQSSDNGKNWSSLTRVFDAVSARWGKIGNPKISLSADGVLHLIFSRTPLQAGQPAGLYYSRSVDGGKTWSESRILSEGEVRWSHVVSYDEQTVHVLWQEYDSLVFANLSQVSQDSGVTWGKTLDITGVNDHPSPVALAANGLGNLHFIQLLKNNNETTIKQDNLTLQDWNWTGSGWEFASSSDLVVRGLGENYSLTADITSDGFLGVSMSAEYTDPENIKHNEILTFNRFLEEPNTLTIPMVALIPTPVILSNTTESPNSIPTQSVELSAINDDNLTSSRVLRNIIGILIIVIILVVTAVLLIRGRKVITKE